MKKIGIIGMGKLGLCLALNLERAGFSVFGVEKNETRINHIANKTLETSEPEVEQLLANSKNLIISSNINLLIINDVSLIFVVVPTPSLPNGAFSHEFIETVIEELESNGRNETRKILVINSTTMPGYCDTIVDRLNALNYDLIYNPEFIAQGSIISDQRNPDQVLIGAKNEVSANEVKTVYDKLCENAPSYCIMDLKSAEISKLATNCFLTMKISFANHLGDLAQKVGANADEILACIGADTRIGSKYLKYGYGYGGPCFPRDNKAFMHFGEEHAHPLHLSAATDRINDEHFRYQLASLKASNQAEFYFDDLAYKAGTDIIEESQQLRLALALAQSGEKVRVKATQHMRDTILSKFGDIFHFDLE